MSVSERQSRLLEECLSAVNCWSNLVKKYVKNDEKATAHNSIQNIVKTYCAISFETKQHDDALKHIENHLSESQYDTTLDPDRMFKTLMEQADDDFDYEGCDIWNRFCGELEVEEVSQTRQSVGDNKYETLSDSVMYSEVFKVPIDPLMKTEISEPYRNTNCGHVYEYRYILEYIKNTKRKAKCPYVGCANTRLCVDDLIKDDTLQKKILEFSQRNSTESSQATNVSLRYESN